MTSVIELKKEMLLILRDETKCKITSVENEVIISKWKEKRFYTHRYSKNKSFELTSDANNDVMQILDGDKIVWQRQELQPSDIKIGDKLQEINRGMSMTVVGIWSHLDATTANTTISMDFEGNEGDVWEYELRELKRVE